MNTAETVVQRYKIKKILGEGGIGAVFLVDDTYTHDEKALKTLKYGFVTDDLSNKFSKEFRVLYQLKHPGIVQCYDYGRDEAGAEYFTMEVVRWPTLAKIKLKLAEADIVRLLIDIAETLAFVHSHQISHLDLKPNNIFVNEKALLEGGDSILPLVKIGDFGLSSQQVASDVNQRRGTFIYSAPEMFFPDKVGMHADIFSVGMLGFTLLSGDKPYTNCGYSQSIDKKIHWLPTQQMWDEAGVSPQLASLLTRCLNPNPSLRPRSTNELLAELCVIGSKRSSARPTDITAPFVGRVNELRHLSVILNKVSNGEQWIAQVFGDSGIGKSRLIDEFAIRKQLKGHRVVKVDGNDINMLLRYYDIYDGEATLSYKEFEEAWSQIIYSHEENPTQLPLIVCWHNFHRTDDSKVKLLKKLIIHHPNIRMLWLLETDSDISQFSSLTYFNHLLRRHVGDLKEEDAGALVAKLFGEPFGHIPFSKNIYSLVGGRPAWLIHLLKKLIELEHIKYKSGKWFIPDPDISYLFDSLADAFQFDLTRLSRQATWVVEWLAVLNQRCSIRFLKSELEITDTAWSSAMDELKRIGLIEIVGESVMFALPIFRESIYKQLPDGVKESLHHTIGSWYEGNYTDSGSLDGMLTIARHYYEGNKPNSFLRVMERIIEAAPAQIRHRIDEWFILRALAIESNPLSDEHQFICRDALGKNYFFKKKFQDAANVFTDILAENRFTAYRTDATIELNLGKCYALIPDFANALIHLELAYESLEKNDPAMAGEALSRIIYIRQRQGEYETGLRLLRSYRNLITEIAESKDQLPHWIKCARLNMLHSKFEDAIECNSNALNHKQDSKETRMLVMSAYRIQIQILVAKGDWKEAIKVIDYVENNHLLTDEGKWRNLHLRAIALISGGQNDKALRLMDKIELIIAGSARPLEQCYIHLDLIGVEYISGRYLQGIRRIRQAMGVARRGDLDNMKAIIASWAVLFRDMMNLPVVKLIDYTTNLINEADNPISDAVASFNLAEHFLNIGEPKPAMPLFELCLNNSVQIDYDIPMPLLDILLLRCRYEAFPILDNVNWENYERMSVRLYHGITKGSYYYNLMNVAISTKEEKNAKRFFDKAMIYFRMCNAPFMIYKCQLKYGKACLELSWQDSSENYHAHVARLNIGLGLPMKQLDSQMLNQFAFAPRNDHYPSLNELAKIVDTLNSMKSSDRLAQRLLELALDSVNAERGLLILSKSRGSKLSHRAAIRVGRKEEETISRTLAEKVYNDQEPIIVENAMEDEFLNSIESVQLNRIFAVACLPIVVGENIEGILYLDHGRLSRSFTETDRDYLTLLTNLIGTVMSYNRMVDTLRKDVKTLRYSVDQLEGYDEIIGQSKAMRKVFSLLQLLKNNDISVMILGESGTGKELIARVIHRQSIRSSKPFFAINCAAMQDTLIESLLFGHVKGAFTGADSDRRGFFEEADGGTIFLDEVDEMSIAMQGKLLRVLQEGEFFAVGDTKVKKSNVRLITAAKDTLPKLVEDGGFREDLYFRINVVQIKTPPLRERISDILPIAHFYIREQCQKKGITVNGIKRNAEIILQRYLWPGNVRQLENVIQRIFLFVEDNQYIDVHHLPKEVVSAVATFPEDNEPLRAKLGKVEMLIIQEALLLCGGNKSEVARKLGISRPTLKTKMKRHGLEV